MFINSFRPQPNVYQTFQTPTKCLSNVSDPNKFAGKNFRSLQLSFRPPPPVIINDSSLTNPETSEVVSVNSTWEQNSVLNLHTEVIDYELSFAHKMSLQSLLSRVRTCLPRVRTCLFLLFKRNTNPELSNNLVNNS